MLLDQILIYGGVLLLSGGIIWYYLRRINQASQITQNKIEKAKETGRYEPNSLHPHIDLTTCIGSGACVKACPEKDILGIVNGKATVINATSCVGHGACFHACPVEAISLKIGTESRGVELPHVDQTYETNMKGIYIAGELGGMGLIKNSVEQGKQAVENIFRKEKSPKKGVLDLLIIGAGPAGIAGSLTAKKLGLSFITLEQDTLGGTVYSFPRSKIVMTHPMELPLFGKVKLFDTSKDELLGVWNNALNENEVVIVENTKVDRIIPTSDDTFKVYDTNEQEYITNHVLIAIGRRGSPRKLNIPGESLPKVAYRLIESEHIRNKKIVVVGGGDSAVESAMLLMDQNEVTLSYRKEQFARIKTDNLKRIESAIKDKKINVVFESNLVQIEPEHVVIAQKNKENNVTLANDLVYIFVGGELPTTFLKNAGVEINKRFGMIVKSHKNK